jgi:hypothetical protein
MHFFPQPPQPLFPRQTHPQTLVGNALEYALGLCDQLAQLLAKLLTLFRVILGPVLGLLECRADVGKDVAHLCTDVIVQLVDFLVSILLCPLVECTEDAVRPEKRVGEVRMPGVAEGLAWWGFSRVRGGERGNAPFVGFWASASSYFAIMDCVM